MKKLISVLLAALLLLPAAGITAFAEDEGVYKTELEKSGYSANYFEALCDYKDFKLCRAHNGKVHYYTDPIDGMGIYVPYYVRLGNYVFEFYTGHEPYPPELYLVNAEKAFTLEDAYKLGIVDDEGLDLLYPYFKKLVKNIVNRDAQTITENYMSRNYGYKPGYFQDIMKLGDKIAAISYKGEKSGHAAAFLGGKKLLCNHNYAPYCLGLWIIDGENVYTLSDAYNNKVISDDELAAVADKINGNYGMQVKDYDSTEKSVYDYLVDNKLFDEGNFIFYRIADFGGNTLVQVTAKEDYKELAGDYLITPGKTADKGVRLLFTDGEKILTVADAVENGVAEPDEIISEYKAHGNGAFEFTPYSEAENTDIKDEKTDTEKQTGEAPIDTEPEYLRNFNALMKKLYGDRKITVTTFEKLSNGNYLVSYTGESDFYADILCICYVDKYVYTCGVTNRPLVFNGKSKLTELDKAYEKGIISKSDLKTADKILPNMKVNKLKLKAGKTVGSLYLRGWEGSCKSSDKKIVRVTKDGDITALTKGKTTITAKSRFGGKISIEIKVTTNPKLSKKAVAVKKGSTVKIKVSGKAEGFDLKFKNTKKAAVISKAGSAKVKVKGYIKGKTRLFITVNGKKLGLNVRVVL